MGLVTHIKEHSVLGLPEAYAVLPSRVQLVPATNFAPLSCGSLDAANQESLANVQAYGGVFLMPSSGFVTEIGFTAQGNAGNAATARDIRWTLCEIKAGSAGNILAISRVIATAVVAVAGNVSGKVVLATGLSIAVPAKYVLFIKQGNTFVPTDTIRCASVFSGGPIPGNPAVITGPQYDSAALLVGPVDLSTPTPAALLVDDPVMASGIKQLAFYCGWRNV